MVGEVVLVAEGLMVVAAARMVAVDIASLKAILRDYIASSDIREPEAAQDISATKVIWVSEYLLGY